MRRATTPYVVWGVGVLAYAIAVINRSSFATLGPLAQTHFHIAATELSTFVFVQLLVYAAAQVPVGIAMQRFGISRVVVVGLSLMTLGQLMLSSIDVLWLAILARGLLGAGDACIFICVIRLVSNWFTPKQIPVMTQLTGVVGQAGQLASVAPLALYVGAFGWQVGFLSLAGLTLLWLALVILVMRDDQSSRPILSFGSGRISPRAGVSPASAGEGSALVFNPPTEAIPVFGAEGSGVWRAIRQLLRRPGTRLAFWIHFTTPYCIHVFALLWGTPFLIGGMGRSSAEAALVLSALVITTMAGSVIAGPILSRLFKWRVHIAIAVAILIMAVWAITLLWPGKAPLWWLVVLAVTIGIGGPTSMVSFDVLRTHTHTNHLSIGTGIVNTGGFIATIIAVLAIGVALDLQGAGSPSTYSYEAFRIAMLCQMPIWVLGIVMMIIEYPKGLRELQRRRRTILPPRDR